MRFAVSFISDEINVSSSADYFATVFLIDHNTRVKRAYWINGDSFLALTPGWAEWMPPKYLAAEVRRQLGTLMQSGKVTYFEYDRDHQKRYEGLRYFDAEHAALLAQGLLDKEKGTPT